MPKMFILKIAPRDPSSVGSSLLFLDEKQVSGKPATATVANCLSHSSSLSDP